MKINASVGVAKASVSLNKKVYRLTLTAQTEGEEQWLASLFVAVRQVNPNSQCLRENKPRLAIVHRERG